ncbi:hypothetical protein ACQ4PT_013573 [Festuca glaucescens]
MEQRGCLFRGLGRHGLGVVTLATPSPPVEDPHCRSSAASPRLVDLRRVQTATRRVEGDQSIEGNLGGETMPRVLYCARTCPPLEPPFPLPPAIHKEPSSTPSIQSTTATQQHVVDLADLNSPLPDPNHQDQDYYDYETDSDCPPSPEQQDYSDHEDECFQSHLLNVPEYASTALEHYNSQDKHKIKYQLIKAIVSCKIVYDGFYQHVNFTAKSTLENSKEEFFFVELRRDHDIQAWVTCMHSCSTRKRESRWVFGARRQRWC